MTVGPAGWRTQTARERELIETVLLAQFPGRDEIAIQLRGAMVGAECACGCGSFAVLPNEGSPGARCVGVVFEAEGRDEADRSVVLQVVVASSGLVDFIECTGVDPDSASSLPRPETLRAFVEVAPVGNVRSFKLSERTIFEGAGIDEPGS